MRRFQELLPKNSRKFSNFKLVISSNFRELDIFNVYHEKGISICEIVISRAGNRNPVLGLIFGSIVIIE